VRQGAVRLAAGLGHDVLELRFDSAWQFADATLMPALADRPRRVEALAGALRRRGT
jgi:hypothetical protein